MGMLQRETPLGPDAPGVWRKVNPAGGAFEFLTESNESYLIFGGVCDPLIPDPAYDRQFPTYWMERLLRGRRNSSRTGEVKNLNDFCWEFRM